MLFSGVGCSEVSWFVGCSWVVVDSHEIERREEVDSFLRMDCFFLE